MNSNLTELVFVTDMSGSMDHLTDDTIGGINSVLKSQKESGRKVLVSLVLFNDESTVRYDRMPIEEVTALTTKDYVACGCTALHDALGGAVHHISNVHKYIRDEDTPEKTMFVVTTDGMENASSKYTLEQVRKMISEKQEKCGWEFLFLGANIDAYEAGQSMGFRKERISNYIPDTKGSKLVYEAVTDAFVDYCENEDMTNWNAPIEADYAKRNGGLPF